MNSCTSEDVCIKNAGRALNAVGSEGDVRYAVAKLIESSKPPQNRPSVRQDYRLLCEIHDDTIGDASGNYPGN